VNILSNFVRILSQKCDNKVKVQIIQTLSILVQNLSNEVSIFYLLSNNYIKSVERYDNTRALRWMRFAVWDGISDFDVGLFASFPVT
jgi:hypothetical protein